MLKRAMNARALLADRIANHDLCPGTDTVDAWLSSNWVRFRFGDKLVHELKRRMRL